MSGDSSDEIQPKILKSTASEAEDSRTDYGQARRVSFAHSKFISPFKITREMSTIWEEPYEEEFLSSERSSDSTFDQSFVDNANLKEAKEEKSMPSDPFSVEEGSTSSLKTSFKTSITLDLDKTLNEKDMSPRDDMYTPASYSIADLQTTFNESGPSCSIPTPKDAPDLTIKVLDQSVQTDLEQDQVAIADSEEICRLELSTGDLGNNSKGEFQM